MAAPMKILREADDVTPEILKCVEEAVEWFPSGEKMPVDEFFDRLCASTARKEFNWETLREEWVGWDIDDMDSPAARKLLREARKIRRDQRDWGQ